MKMRLADYMADFLVENGITQQFSVTGGGAMFLNDAFGHKEGLNCIYNHHEQASAIAAEGYARASGKVCSLCVTTGPGGTNALTGVVGAWLDSIPMFVISGQVKFVTTIASCPELGLRQLGDQEFNIVDCVKTMTKYAVMVTDPNTIKYHMKKALYIATHGRSGPVWLDIPVNVQNAEIDTDNLIDYDESEDANLLPPKPDKNQIDELIDRVTKAKRPVILAGEGIRCADSVDIFHELVNNWKIPVVTAWNAHDLATDDNPYYAGRPGSMGTRGGNLVVQTADLVLSLGCRMNVRQISYNWDSFARDAFLAYVDIDKAELNKPTLNNDKRQVGLKIHADLKEFLPLVKDRTVGNHDAWVERARYIDKKYPAVRKEFYQNNKPLNPYVFFKRFSSFWDENEMVVVTNGSCCVSNFQALEVKKGQRIFGNSGCASMGYGLPAAIGASASLNGKRVICMEGDGSIQMNLQELQTAVYNKSNLKIVWVNNDGYHSIRQTQTNNFKANFCGVSDGNGISFPEAERIAYAYKIPFFKVDAIDNLDETIKAFLSCDGNAILEAVVDKTQFFEPKLSSKIQPDGSIVTPQIEDMYPFLDADEFKEIIEFAKKD